MADIYTPDPNRILFGCSVGSLQAWQATEGDTCLNFSFYAGFQHAEDTKSYMSVSHNLTVADARGLAAALIRAADHAETVKIVPPEEVAA